MTRKKLRNKLAKSFNHAIPFVTRHKMANKLYATFDYLNSLNCFPIRLIDMAEIPYTKNDSTIDMYGFTFAIIVNREWDDDVHRWVNVECINFIG